MKGAAARPTGRRIGIGRAMIALAMLAVLAGSAGAQISFVDMFRSDTFIQTGNGNSIPSNGSFFASHLFSVNADDFNTVQMAYPGPASPANLSKTDPKTFSFQTGLFPTQVAMDAAFPFGTYTFNANGNIGPKSTSFSYTADHYPASQPFLTGTDFTQLQGMNAGAPFNVHFSPFNTGGVFNFSFIFFTIFDPVANTFVFNDGFLPSSTTGDTIPANTLKPNHAYLYELIFSNRVLTDSPGAAFQAQIGFDLRTQARFTTGVAAVPEPSVLAMAGAALIALGAFRWRRKRA